MTINLVIAWLWVLLGFFGGAVMGMRVQSGSGREAKSGYMGADLISPISSCASTPCSNSSPGLLNAVFE